MFHIFHADFRSVHPVSYTHLDVYKRQYIDRMEESGIPKIAKDYNPRGRRKVGRLKKR